VHGSLALARLWKREVLPRLRSGLGLGCDRGPAAGLASALVFAARGCEIWLSADGLGVAARVRVAAIASARGHLRPDGGHVRWRGGWRA
jgi:hypothetical protein